MDKQDENIKTNRLFQLALDHETSSLHRSKFLAKIKAYKEVISACKGNINNEELEKALKYINQVTENIDTPYRSHLNNNISFELGLIIGRYFLSCESHFKQEEIYNSIESTRKRNQPLQLKNITLSCLKEYAQETAKHLWSKEAYKEKRLGEMCELTWSELFKQLREGENSEDDEDREFSSRSLKCLPDKPEGLKSWLRPIAPEQARRRGRPKK